MGQTKAILYTIDEFHHGGATTFVRQYCSVAHELGIQTIVVGFSGDLKVPKELFPFSIIYLIPQRSEWGFWGRIINTIHYADALRKVYQLYAIDRIHLSTTWSSISAYCVPETWRKKRIITFYGLHDREILSANIESSYIKRIIKGKFHHFMQYLTLLFTPKIITFSTYAKQLLRLSFGNAIDIKTSIIPGFIINLPTITARIKHSTTLNIINFGRAEPRKGIAQLLQALHIVNTGKIRYKATIASPVQYYRDYDALTTYEALNLNTQVQFLHVLDDKQKKKLLLTSDVFVLPSQALETFGMTTIESLACGIPVIGTHIGATPEILSKIDARLICEGISAKSIANKLMWFYNLSSGQRRLISQKAIILIKKEYTGARNKTFIRSLYEN